MYALMEDGEVLELFETLKECQEVANELQYCVWIDNEVSQLTALAHNVVDFAQPFMQPLLQLFS